MPGLKKTWSTNSSTQPKNGLPKCCCCWLTLARKARPQPIIADISQETLAVMIGTTRSRVSHFMNKFRQLGFIDYKSHLEVHSSLLSVVLNERPNTVEPPE
jgi:Crp-like helix-turn-helix domain